MSEHEQRTLRLGLVQMAMGESPEANLDRAIAAVREAAGEGARLVCLPELFRSRYFCQSEDEAKFAFAETIPGPTTERLAELASELDITLVASVFERRAPGLFHNSAAVLDAGRGFVGMYRKMHIPDDPRYYEKYYFAPGDLGFKSFATSAGKVGVLICWDQWYPEAARLTALAGAELICYPTAIGWHVEEKATLGSAQHAAWETMQRSHAVANGCFVACVNRVGFEPDPGGEGGIEFWGQSFVAGPGGQLLARAPEGEEAVLVCDIDLASVEATRIQWPFLRDRRVDAYAGLECRYIDCGAEKKKSETDV